MVVNNQKSPGMSTGEILTDTISSNGDSTKEKRGRGRPAGSLNKSNDLTALRDEVKVLTAKVESLQVQLYRVEQAPSVQLNVPATSNQSSQSDKRLDVIQSWVETFHQFLLTSRITNSVDRVAEDELALIMDRLPDNAEG